MDAGDILELVTLPERNIRLVAHLQPSRAFLGFWLTFLGVVLTHYYLTHFLL